VDVAVVCVSLSHELADENRDLVNLDLPGYQQQLVEEIHLTGTPVVVVLINGNPLTINWIDQNNRVVEPGLFQVYVGVIRHDSPLLSIWRDVFSVSSRPEPTSSQHREISAWDCDSAISPKRLMSSCLD